MERWDNSAVISPPKAPSLTVSMRHCPKRNARAAAFADCAAYAQAITPGEAAINQCPPGGAEGIARLSRITGLPVQPLNPLNGVEAPRAVAIIDEAWCIGCTLCIKACPTDAIIGSNKLMHTVIEPYCTGASCAYRLALWTASAWKISPARTPAGTPGRPRMPKPPENATNPIACSTRTTTAPSLKSFRKKYRPHQRSRPVPPLPTRGRRGATQARRDPGGPGKCPGTAQQ